MTGLITDVSRRDETPDGIVETLLLGGGKVSETVSDETDLRERLFE